MKTTKPISTISYNTPSFLALKLNELTKAHKIAFWSFIEHLPEDDEGLNKTHCHVYIEPACSIQTEELRDELLEYDPEMPDKPRKCLPFFRSVFGDWYLYGLHDVEYLATKNQTRRYHYHLDHFQASDEDTFLFNVRTIDLSALTPIKRLRELLQAGMQFSDALANGYVPIPQISAYMTAWAYLEEHERGKSRTFRNGHQGHEDEIEPRVEVSQICGAYADADTGEVVQPNFEELSPDDELPY